MADSDQAGAPPAAPEPLVADSSVAPPVPAAPPPPPPPETLGQTLRRARLAQGLTIDQLSTELRIEAKQLTALEDERFEEIGVPVFIKGYLKQYGTRLGLDFRDLLAEYYKQTTLADVQVQPSRTIKLRDERQVTSWVLAVVVLLVVVAGLAVWWWSGAGFTVAPTSSAPPAAPPAPAALAPQPQSEPRSPSPAAPPPLDATQAPVAENAAGAPLVPAAAPSGEPAEVGGNASAAPIVAIPLELAFDEETSAEVTDGRGERLLSGSTAAGQRVTVRGEPPFAIVLGNANAVRLTVDGEPYAIPTVGREGSLARFSVDVAEE